MTKGLVAAMLCILMGGIGLAQDEIRADRVAEIAPMLTDGPMGLGPTIDDRVAWEAVLERENGAKTIAQAEAVLAGPITEQPDDLYLDFSKTGNRTRWQRVASRRRGRVPTLVLAECFEDEGRFIPAFEEIVAALCAEKTWVMPAHDRSLVNFEQKQIDIDLASASLAWNLATARSMLGDRLSDETSELIRANVTERVLDPYRAMSMGERGRNWWMNTTNNWNSVCLGGVAGTALATLESRDDRAYFIASAEHFSKNFLRGFTSDGYCTEGTGYWNYGFGYYVLLAETVRQATDAGVDLFAGDSVEAPATYGARIGIINGVCPAFADCGVTTRPSSRIMQFMNRIYGLGLARYTELDMGLAGSLYETGIYSFENSASAIDPPAPGEGGEKPRDWFEEMGILLARPGEGSDARMGVALKGGHNAEHHNHNDVGSFVVVVGDRPVLLDPGSETYTARTFSSQRYESNVLNSWGHPVPRVAGELQRTGKDAKAQVIQAEFTDAADTLMLDIASAYDVPDLTKLDRTFVYSREGDGTLRITDEVAFAHAQDFGTALITLGQWEDKGDGELLVYDFDEAVTVKIEASAAVTVGGEEIKEDSYGDPIRIGIDFVEPVAEATVTLTITPVELPSAEDTLLRNGGFEEGGYCWDMQRDQMGRISSVRAATGDHSLHIVDSEKGMGSNIFSAKFPLTPGAKYELRGQSYPVSGEGVGMYVRFYNAAGEEVTPKDGKGNVPSVGTLAAGDAEWTSFAFPFTPVEGATVGRVWIHSYNAGIVEAFIDDLEIVKLD